MPKEPKTIAMLDVSRRRITYHKTGRVKIFDSIDQALQELSAEAEQYEYGQFHIQEWNGSVTPDYDVFWLRDHYLEPFKTEDITKLKTITLYDYA